MDYINIPGSANKFFVLFHGTGGNEYSLLSVVGDIDANASVISFLGDVGTGVERRFFAPLENGKLAREDFDEKISQFLTFWDSIKPSGADLTFIGYSNGANFLIGLLEQRPDIADKVILMHPANLGYNFENGSASDILITSGATDTMTLASDSLQLSKQLAEKFPSTKLVLLDGGHSITADEIAKMGAFLNQE